MEWDEDGVERGGREEKTYVVVELAVGGVDDGEEGDELGCVRMERDGWEGNGGRTSSRSVQPEVGLPDLSVMVLRVDEVVEGCGYGELSS